MPEILFLTLAAVVSGCSTWEAIHTFGIQKLDWLRNFLPYKNKIPSHDTLGAFFSAFERNQFADFFMEFTRSLADKRSRVIAIDDAAI